jgi:hypothetical protein
VSSLASHAIDNLWSPVLLRVSCFLSDSGSSAIGFVGKLDSLLLTVVLLLLTPSPVWLFYTAGWFVLHFV